MNARAGRASPLPLGTLPGGIVARARQLARIRDQLAAILDDDEAAHLVGVSLQGNKLTIFADSAVWCTRLRYQAPRLETRAQALLRERPQMSFRVQPPTFRARQVPPRALPPQAVAALNAAAHSIGKSDAENAPLAAALRRLAGHGD